MRHAKRWHWLAALLLMALVLPARAEKESASPTTHVILVGISQYGKDSQIKPRPRAEDDARALYMLLTDKSKNILGTSADNVRLLLGNPDGKLKVAQKATRDNILKAVREVVGKAKRGDLVLFAFIGQGGSLGERGDRVCYFAVDSTLKGRGKDAIADADFAQEFDKLKTQQFCVFLDVNFRGFDAGQESIPDVNLGQNAYREFLGDDKTDEKNPLPGRVVFLATNGLSQSLDLKEHGIFTTALLEALAGSADKEGGPDGWVTVDELTAFLSKKIPDLLRKHAAKPEEQRRLHWVVGGRQTHYPISRNPEVYEKTRKTLAEFKTLKLDPKLAEEGEKLLDRMPRLETRRKLRKAYEELVEKKLSVDDFKTRRQQILASMELPEKEVRSFASKILQGAAELNRGYVKEVPVADLVQWAIRGLYRTIDEPIPEDIAGRLDKIHSLDSSELGLLLMDVRKRLGKREDLDKHKDIDFALKRMTGKLDPYTTYIDPEEVERFKTEYKGRFSGVGVQIRKDLATEALQVVTPILGSPSYKLGIKAGDLIVAIIRDVDSEGNPLDKTERLETKDLSLSDAVKKILGKAGTRVTLVVRREGVKEELKFEITRGRIEVESVFGVKRKADDTWDFWKDPDKKIAYIRLSGFADGTADTLKEVVKKLKAEGMKGLVLDLRFNPGGLLDSAKEISDLFIDDGPIVSIRRPRQNLEQRLNGTLAGSQTDFPMVVLINGLSASASEIVSACLQDHKRAVIVGERSYGKGSVQNISEFDGGELKITIATFWRPSGKNLNKSGTSGKDDEDWGVMPSKGFLVELSRKERDDLEEHLRNSEIIPNRDLKEQPTKKEFVDRQLEKALEYLRKEVTTTRR